MNSIKVILTDATEDSDLIRYLSQQSLSEVLRKYQYYIAGSWTNQWNSDVVIIPHEWQWWRILLPSWKEEKQLRKKYLETLNQNGR